MVSQKVVFEDHNLSLVENDSWRLTYKTFITYIQFFDFDQQFYSTQNNEILFNLQTFL